MNTKDCSAILHAVEQALAICDSYGDRMDEIRRKICEDLRGVRMELRKQLGLPLHESS